MKLRRNRLVRAGAEAVLCPVAVSAEDLKFRRETLGFQPLHESAYRLRRAAFSMFRSVVVDVVDREEHGPTLATAKTLAAVGSEYLVAERPTDLLHAGPTTRDTVSIRGLVERVVGENAATFQTPAEARRLGQLIVLAARAEFVSTHSSPLIGRATRFAPSPARPSEVREPPERSTSRAPACSFWADWPSHITTIAQAER